MDLSINVRKKVILVSSFIECLILGGPTYGWPSLVYVLRDRGYFSDQCLNGTSTSDEQVEYDINRSFESADMQGYPTCAEQDARLQLVFIIGSFGHSTGALIFGVVYDKFGIRLPRIISSIFIVLACLLFAFSSPSTSYLSFIALHLLATGGAVLLITNTRVGNLFGIYRSTITTLLCGAFASSTITMVFVQIAYTGGISLMACFLFLACVTMFFNINTFVLLPKYKIPWPLPDNWDKAVVVSSQCGTEDVDERSSSTGGAVKKTFWADVEYPTLLCCLISPMFLLFLMWFSILQLAHFFYLGTINPRLQQLSNDDNDIVSTYTTTYTALHSTSIISSFFCGLVLDRNKKKMTNDGRGPDQRISSDDLQDSVLALLLTNLLTAAFNICSMIPVVPVQLLTFILEITGRIYLFALQVSFLTMAFPAKYFGSVYGICRFITACIALLQYPLFQMVQVLFDDNPFYVDLLLLFLNLCSLAQPLYVYYFVWKGKSICMKVEN